MAKKKWIKQATENAHGQFKAKAEKAGESTAAFASEHAGDSGKLGKQALLAKALMGMHKGKKEEKKAPTGKNMRSKMYGSKEE